MRKRILKFNAIILIWLAAVGSLAAQSISIHCGSTAKNYRINQIDSITFDATTDEERLGDTVLYHVESYGIAGDGETDDLPKLTELFLKAAKQKKPTKIVFCHGATYRLGKHLNDLYGRIPIFRAKDMVVDGNGCTFLGHPTGRIFALYRSENITLRNFHMDYSPLPFTQGKVTKVNPSNYYLEFQVDEGYDTPQEGDGSYYKAGNKMVDCITANSETRKFYQGHSTVNKVERKNGERVFGVSYGTRDQSQLKVGDYFVMKVTYEDAHQERALDQSVLEEYGEYMYDPSGNITVKQCNGVVLENIASHSAPLMTFTMRETSRPVFRNCRIEAIEDRIVAGNSDGVHLNGNESQPLLEGCYFERTMDDAIHVKMAGDKVSEVLAKNMIRTYCSDIVWNNTCLGEGKTVMIYDYELAKQLAMCRIVAYEPLNCREGICTLDQEVEGMKEGTFVYLQANEDEEATIRNCSFGTQLQRAILCHQPTLVSGCTIEDNGTGFDLALMSGGIEGPPTQRLTIENTKFLNLAWSGMSVICPSKNYDQKGEYQLIVRGCTFDLQNDVPLISIQNSNGLMFTDNTVYKSSTMIQGNLIQRTNTSNLHQSGNVIYTKAKNPRIQ